MVGLSKAACALCWAAAASALSTPTLSSSTVFKCDLPPELNPAADGLPSAQDVFSSDAAFKLQVYRHSEIVKVPSISYDDNGEPGEDSRWEVFYKLHSTFEALYPKFHAAAEKETVNTFGLVYTLKGSDPSLKPLMLAAHQDVVPVADPKTWKYPPFSAHFDGRWLWGRGASDDKNSVTGLFSALETLLDRGWEPKRDVILAMGFDEECSGRRGAGTIGPFLLERYGKNAMAFLLDEGGMGLRAIGDVLYALPAVMEKGHVDIFLDLTIAGGHSSMPYPHTGIGVMSSIVQILESHPYTPKLLPRSPVHNHLVCQSRFSPDFNPQLTKLVNHGTSPQTLAEIAAVLVELDRAMQYTIQTSQAVDIFNGGVKINAMPERVLVGVNHRIAPQDNVETVKENILRRIKPVVKKFGIKVHAFQGEPGTEELLARVDSTTLDEHEYDGGLVEPMYEVDYNATLVITTSQNTKVAPQSPTEGEVWDIFAGTIRHTFAFDNGTVVPVGEIMTGNTDTRHYLDLTPNIYRWMPTRDGSRVNPHTVDEGIDMYSHMDVLRFYYDLIRNFDASDAAKVSSRPREDEVMGEL